MQPVNRQEAERLIRDRGKPELVAQLNDGMLAPESFDRIVRDILFEPVAWADPFRKINPDAVRRVARQRGLLAAGEDGFVEFESLEADSLEPAEYQMLMVLRREMPEARIQALWTVATCGELQQRYPKARIVLEFGGRSFVREVDLKEIPCTHCGKGPSLHVHSPVCKYEAGEKGEAMRVARQRNDYEE